jgi:ubiquitin-activating enzyme E1
VAARLFVDSQCVWYHKYLFESGTLGTKCNSQVVIPKHTQSYGDSQDPAEETIPLCTLKNFPYQIEHTIQWARDYFEGTFCEGPAETFKFIQDPQGYLKRVCKELKQKPAMLRARLEAISTIAKASLDRTYETCIKLARNCFDDIFDVQIVQLTHSFPQDYLTS